MFTKSDLVILGKGYDLSETSFIVLDINFNIKYANSYIKELLNWNNDWLNSSFHIVWKSLNLPDIIDKMPTITLKHFTHGYEVIDFIKQLPAKDKKGICILSDYELLSQNINGIEVIKQTGIKRSTLVTSHYADNETRKQAIETHVKVLPKELAFTISVNISNSLV